MSWKTYNERKNKAIRIYQKMQQVLSKDDLEYFDVCKDYISKLIAEDEIKQLKKGA